MISLAELFNTNENLKVVYPGRFQPFSKHHLQVYKNLVQKFGKDKVFILTSDKIEPEKSPFNFKDKLKIMTAMGVPKANVIQVKSTYAPTRQGELTAGWDKILKPGDKLLVILGQKDTDRLSIKYYQPFTNVENMEDYTKHAYFSTESADIKYKDPITNKTKILDGTSIREIFRNPRFNKNQKYKQFKAAFGTDNTQLFNFLFDKLNSNMESIAESIITEGIKHIEDMKPDELLNFLKMWNIDDKQFVVTEKVDGRQFDFGVNQGGFYVSSRTRTFKNVSEYPSKYFYDDFKKYHRMLQYIDFIGIAEDTLQLENVDSVSFKGEAIASYDTNIVIYNKDIIGDGIYVIFEMFVDGNKLKQDNIEKMVAEINKESKIKFYSKMVVDAKGIKFNEKYVTTLEKIINSYGNVLSKRAYNPMDKILKNKVKRIINLIGKQSKTDFLRKMKDYKPQLGSDYEGLVVELPNGEMVKLVNKEKFTKAKKENWKYIDEMNTSSKIFRKSIKENPNSLKIALKKFKKSLIDSYKDFNQFGDEHITIPSRKKDTIEQFKMFFNLINIITPLVGTESNDILVNKILNREIGESVIVTEGGKTFPGMSAIPNELMIPTIQFFLKNIDMANLKYELTGNYKKPLMGDIDIAVDYRQLANIIGSQFNSPADKNQFFSDLDTYIKTHKNKNILDYKINKGLQQFSAAVPAIDKDNNFVPDTNVQIDIMIGDREWMKRALGPATDSKYKAAHRNFLYTAAFSQIEKETGKVDIKQKYQFNMKHGVETVDFTYDNKGKRVKLSKNLITGNVEDMVHLLFDDSVSFNDVNSFEELYHMMLTDKFKYPELRNEIFKEFVNTVKNMRLPVPTELVKYE